MKQFSFIFLLFLFSITKAQVLSIPYNDLDGFPIIKVKIDNKDYDFVFDTGAVISVINSDTFKNKKVVDQKEIGDISNQKKYIDIAIENFEIDHLQFKNFAIAYQSFSHLKLCHNQLDGIIGRDIMNKFIIEFRTDKMIINFYERVTDINLLNYKIIKLENSTEPKVLVSINNQKRFALLDTGSNGNLVISDHKMNKFISKSNHIAYLSSGKSFGLHGRVNDIKKQYDLFDINLKLKNFDLANQNITLSDFDENNMGYRFLKQFNFIVDLKANNFYINRNENYIQESLSKVQSFTPSLDIETNKWFISKINIEEKQLKLNDIILKINNQNLPIVKDSCLGKEQFVEFMKSVIKKIESITVLRNDEEVLIKL